MVFDYSVQLIFCQLGMHILAGTMFLQFKVKIKIKTKRQNLNHTNNHTDSVPLL